MKHFLDDEDFLLGIYLECWLPIYRRVAIGIKGIFLGTITSVSWKNGMSNIPLSKDSILLMKKLEFWLKGVETGPAYTQYAVETSEYFFKGL